MSNIRDERLQRALADAQRSLGDVAHHLHRVVQLASEVQTALAHLEEKLANVPFVVRPEAKP